MFEGLPTANGRADFHVGRVFSRETAKVELGPPHSEPFFRQNLVGANTKKACGVFGFHAKDAREGTFEPWQK